MRKSQWGHLPENLQRRIKNEARRLPRWQDLPVEVRSRISLETGGRSLALADRGVARHTAAQLFLQRLASSLTDLRDTARGALPPGAPETQDVVVTTGVDYRSDDFQVWTITYSNPDEFLVMGWSQQAQSADDCYGLHPLEELLTLFARDFETVPVNPAIRVNRSDGARIFNWPTY